MTPQEIKKHALTYAWEPWLERPCGAFVLSLMARGTRRAIIQKKLGVSMEWRAFVCERGKWYISHEVAELAKKDIVRAFARGGKTIFDITRACEKFYREKKKRIAELNASSAPVTRRMREFIDIISYPTACIWLAHGLQEGGLQKTETPLFDFAEGEGDYNKEYLEALLVKKDFFEWMATRSDHRAIETKQDPEKTAPLSVYAGNVATFILMEVEDQYERLAKGGEEANKGIDFATSHQGIIESFLYKVMLLKGADKKAMNEFWAKNKQSFKENEGIKIQVNVYDKDTVEAWDVGVEYDDHAYKLEPKDIFTLIQESNDLKEQLKAARKDVG